MKAIETLSAKNLFAVIAASLALSAFGSASAANVSLGLQAGPAAVEQGTFEHCGCDNKQGVEMYVQNLINDSLQRGLSCEMSMHVPACLTAYCSSCAGHSGLMESCIKTGMAYFANSCGQKSSGLAFYMPNMQAINQFAN